jgi:hypothetical protein
MPVMAAREPTKHVRQPHAAELDQKLNAYLDQCLSQSTVTIALADLFNYVSHQLSQDERLEIIDRLRLLAEKRHRKLFADGSLIVLTTMPTSTDNNVSQRSGYEASMMPIHELRSSYEVIPQDYLYGGPPLDYLNPRHD